MFIGANSVVPDKVQTILISKSIIALVNDCKTATKIGKNEVRPVNRGLVVSFTDPIMFSAPPAGKQSDIKKVVIRLWDNAEESYGMDIYAYNDREVYLLGKYEYLAYPIINMMIRPMPPNKSLNEVDALKRVP